MLTAAIQQAAGNINLLKQAVPEGDVFIEIEGGLSEDETLSAGQKITLKIYESSLEDLSGAGLGLILKTPVSYMQLSGEAVKELLAGTGTIFYFTVKAVPYPSPSVSNAAQGRPVYDISLTDFTGKNAAAGGAEIAVEYTPAEGEDVSKLYAARVVGSGIIPVEGSYFDGTHVKWPHAENGKFVILTGK